MVDKRLVAEVIDCTPTWEGSLPLLLVIMKEGTGEGAKLAGQELLRMARLADKQVAAMKQAALDTSAATLVGPPIGTGL